MGAHELLHDLTRAGVTLTAVGDRLRVRPASKMTDDLRAAVRAAKPELLTLLARPHRLSPVEADEAHHEPWDDAVIERFTVRVMRFMRHGMTATDADDLAERLHLRDIRLDDRATCVECRHWRRGRCDNHVEAGLLTGDVGLDLATALQRCLGFCGG